MVNKFFQLGKIIFAIFLFCMVPLLQAQDTRASDKPHLTRLAWAGDGHALHYEVLIEKEERGEFRRLSQEFTEKHFTEIHLEPGQYRYGVVSYDLLNRPVDKPNWRNFEVRLAVASTSAPAPVPVPPPAPPQAAPVPAPARTLVSATFSPEPELNNFSPATFNIAQKTELALQVFGKNLATDVEIYLRSVDNDIIFPITQSVLFYGNPSAQVRLLFDHDQLHPGAYEIHVKNPDGLGASIGNLNVFDIADHQVIEFRPTPQPLAPSAPATFFDSIVYHMGAGWMPIVPLGGDLATQTFQQSSYPLGIVARFSAISHYFRSLSIGFELGASWYSANTSVDEYNATLQSVSVEPVLLLQKQFLRQMMAVSLRAGVGTTVQIGTISSGRTRTSLNEYSTHLIAGGSLLFLTPRRFYLETGIDYPYRLSDDASLQYLRPWIGWGVRF